MNEVKTSLYNLPVMKDILVSAISENKEVRCYAIRSTDLVEEARLLHDLSPVACAALGRALSASLIMGSLLKGEDDTITLQFRGDGPLRSIVAISGPNGLCRGSVGNKKALLMSDRLLVGPSLGAGSLTVIKDMHMKSPYVSTTPLVSGEIAEDITYYFASSEQTPTSVGLGVQFDEEKKVKSAGGFLLQLLPGASERTISQLEENLKSVQGVADLVEKDINLIFEKCFAGLGYSKQEEKEVRYQCNCSEERVKQTLISLGEKGLGELIAENKDAIIHCEFCGKDYKYSPEMLLELKKNLQKCKKVSKKK